MSGGLPRGLLNISIPNPETVDDDDFLEQYDEPISPTVLYHFWKTSSVTRDVLQDAAGQRLPNLFWRIWSNPLLRSQLPASRIFELAFRFDQGQDRIALLPPRRGPSATGYSDQTETVPSQGLIVPSTSTQTPPTTFNDSTSSEVPAALSPRSPQSIQKRKVSGVEESPKSVVQYAPASFGSPESPRDYFSMSTAEKAASPGVLRPEPSRSASGTKKRLSFAANTAKSKTRPSVGRKRSSQGSVHQALEQQRSPLKSSPGNAVPREDTSESQRQGILLEAARSPLFELPSASSWQSVEEENDLLSAVPVPKASLSLVDPDFRTKFVENKLRKSGSMVRFAEDLPPDWKKGKDKAQTIDDDERREHSALATRRRTSGDIEVESGDEGSASEGLPRTRSHLSLLIESQRRISGSQNLGPDPPAKPRSARTRGREATAEREDSEDELIQMARKDGVTKAGGVRNTNKLSGGSEHRYRSPTPPPLYG